MDLKLEEELELARDEQARLQREIATLTEQQSRLQQDLLHAQRMEAAGTLAAGVAHDMNNVLGAIMGFCEVLLDQPQAGPMRADLEQIMFQAERGAHLTRSLLAFSRKGQYRKQVIAVDDLIRNTLPLLTQTLAKTIDVRTELGGGDDRIEGDPVQLAQVLVNFTLNAADAMSNRGRLEITSDVVGRQARLRVTDTGCGMDEATRRRVFEPFFTTKPIGQGTGLGLALVWGVVQAHAGTVTVESEPGRGTTFTILLPLTAEAPPEVARPVRRKPPVHTGTILLVDDEEAIRTSISRMLRRAGYEVELACNGADGLRAFATHKAIDLIILDMAMPVMGGPEFFRTLRTVSNVPVLVATGYAMDKDIQALVAQGAGLIEKPFSAAQLLVQVSRLLEPAALRLGA